ncbi:UNVERIFIED_CONTAM: precorrin-2 dehydrogenase/sirohydrochlorin ferrochelatase [Acetivibrio alkalicellulosi]
MPYFPFFINIKGKCCLVVGGGEVATRKVKALIEFGPQIKVISPEAKQYIIELSKEEKLNYIKRKYQEDDLEDVFIVIAATNDKKINEKIYKQAIEKNIFVNVVDMPDMCNFYFPAIVRRDEMVVGISTSGSYPALAKKTRLKIDKMLDDKSFEYFNLLKEYRKKAINEIKNEDKRKTLLNDILDKLDHCDSSWDNIRNEIDNLFEVYK